MPLTHMQAPGTSSEGYRYRPSGSMSNKDSYLSQKSQHSPGVFKGKMKKKNQQNEKTTVTFCCCFLVFFQKAVGSWGHIKCEWSIPAGPRSVPMQHSNGAKQRRWSGKQRYRGRMRGDLAALPCVLQAPTDCPGGHTGTPQSHGGGSTVASC